MGDYVSLLAKSDYYSEEFKKTVKRHLEHTQGHPPDYVVAGTTESPELRALIKEKYVLIAEGPNNLTANYENNSKLFVRKDLITASSVAFELHRSNRAPTPPWTNLVVR